MKRFSVEIMAGSKKFLPVEMPYGFILVLTRTRERRYSIIILFPYIFHSCSNNYKCQVEEIVENNLG